jgi:hypothetical protein
MVTELESFAVSSRHVYRSTINELPDWSFKQITCIFSLLKVVASVFCIYLAYIKKFQAYYLSICATSSRIMRTTFVCCVQHFIFSIYWTLKSRFNRTTIIFSLWQIVRINFLAGPFLGIYFFIFLKFSIVIAYPGINFAQPFALNSTHVYFFVWLYSQFNQAHNFLIAHFHTFCHCRKFIYAWVLQIILAMQWL